MAVFAENQGSYPAAGSAGGGFGGCAVSASGHQSDAMRFFRGVPEAGNGNASGGKGHGETMGPYGYAGSGPFVSGAFDGNCGGKGMAGSIGGSVPAGGGYAGSAYNTLVPGSNFGQAAYGGVKGCGHGGVFANGGYDLPANGLQFGQVAPPLMTASEQGHNFGQQVLSSHAMPGQSNPSGNELQSSGPPCFCGQPSYLLTVRKEGENFGRTFYKCAKPLDQQPCGYFQWTDEPPRSAQERQGQADGPPCYCGQPSYTRACKKEGSNLGRTFHTCAKPRDQQCSYFQWADEPREGQDSVQANGPPCLCGLPTLSFVVKKEGPNTGRSYYRCVKSKEIACGYFQWTDEPPRSAQEFQAPADGPPCYCGQPCITLATKKEGDNLGRNFHKCAKPREQQCRYFQWADEPPRNIQEGQEACVQANGPACFCGLPTMPLVVKKEGPNVGRSFYSCVKSKEMSCGYFQWTDEAPSPPGPPCKCGQGSRQKTVRKEGPNLGRLFFACAWRSCDFFEWADGAPGGKGGPIATPARAGSGYRGGAWTGDYGPIPGNKGGNACFKCGEVGHWASDCPHVSGKGGYGMMTGGAGGGIGGCGCAIKGGRGGRGRGCGRGGVPVSDEWARSNPYSFT